MLNLSCPNRDGKISYGGCHFCSSAGSGDMIENHDLDILKQFNKNKAWADDKWEKPKKIAYYQAYTNTYTTVENLKRFVKPLLNIDEIVAFDFASRPDCLDDEMIAYLNSLTKDKDVWIELGLQTIHDQSARAFNRGYSFKTFKDTVLKLKKTNLKICVHLINGLPNEDRQMMIESAKVVSDLNVDALKIHMLHITKDSLWGSQYLKKPFKLLDKSDYINIVCDQLEVIGEDIIIMRLTGDANYANLLAPLWTTNKIEVLNGIQKELLKRNSYQSKKKTLL